MKLRESFPTGITAILFDIGNVLVDIDTPATLRAFASLGVDGLKTEDIHPHQSGFLLEYELGNISDAEFVCRIRQLAGREIPEAEIWSAWNAMIPSVDPARFELVRSLRKNYRLFVLSNTNDSHIRHLEGLFRAAMGGREFESFFERCFYSHRMHLRKPDPEIYRQVIASIGIPAREILFIDDNACNIPPADALLLRTFHLTGGMTLFDLFERDREK